MAKPVDLELKKAFFELQQKVLSTQQMLKVDDMQIDALRKKQQHAELTKAEIKALSPSTKTYESVGRMFILSEIPEVCNNLTTKIEKCEEIIKTLETNKTYLERSLKDSENNLREMVQQRKDALQDTS